MQVTHVQDHVTHAVIGGGKQMAFGMSDSAEFFNILSNTLYSDKPLAVVREVLCNAWDAHIASGRTGTAIEITLTDSELAIRDFGTGIQKDLMQATYCTYGGSTKQHDGKQTGGFGLGCKAPFAYADHFEVTNYNAGMKTIYQVSKSSGEVGGRPGMIEVVSFPTTETGIKVAIDVNGRHDKDVFEQIIKQIAASGEMNVILNDVLLPTLPFSTATEGFLITNKTVGRGSSYERIFVRYGNVIYPVPDHSKYNTMLRTSRDFLDRLARPIQNNWCLVLQAEPNTISITPSRESLSMTDFTADTLHDLLQNFISSRDKKLEAGTMKVLDETILKAKTSLTPAKMLRVDAGLPLMEISKEVRTMHTLIDFDQVSRSYSAANYPKYPGFRERDVEARLKALIDCGFGNRGKIQTFLAAMKSSNSGKANTWLQQRVIAPLLNGIQKEEHLSANRLLIYGDNMNDDTSRRYRRGPYTSVDFHEASKFRTETLFDCLPYLRNFVVISNSRISVTDELPSLPGMNTLFGKADEFLVYLAPRSGKKVDAAIAFFETRGFWVIDLTTKPMAKEDRIPRVKGPPKKKGLPTVGSMLNPGAKRIATFLSTGKEAERTSSPEFLAKCNIRTNSCMMEDFNDGVSAAIARLFGKRGAVIISETQAEKYAELGALRLTPFLMQEIDREFRSNKRIQTRLSFSHQKLSLSGKAVLHYTGINVLQLVMDDEVLRKQYKVDSQITQDDKDYITIWEELGGRNKYYNRPPSCDVVQKFIDGIAVPPDFEALCLSISRSTLVKIIDTSEAKERLALKKADLNTQQEQARIRDLITMAIKG